MSISNMSFIRGSRIFIGLLLSQAAIGWSNSSSPSPTSLTFPTPSGYSTTLYNVSAATTTLTYNYTNEELAMLWDQVGPISTGPITTTVSPTPEPSSYPRPRVFHPQVSRNPRIRRAANNPRSQHTTLLSSPRNCQMTSSGVWPRAHIKLKARRKTKGKDHPFGI